MTLYVIIILYNMHNKI